MVYYFPFHCPLESCHETYAETLHNYVCFINDLWWWLQQVEVSPLANISVHEARY